MPNKIRLAILSDIHPTFQGNKIDLGETQLKMDGLREPYSNPFEGLSTLIGKESLSVDIVLCAGDLGSKSHPMTIEYSWKELNQLKERIGATQLIATPGNHDHDSRASYSDYDPKGFLQTLSPPFPFSFADENSHFWAWNFDVVDTESVRVLILNTSAYHGINEEYQHGRVTEITIDRIKRKLNGLEKKEINILLCHHHLHKNEEIKIAGYDAMHGAERLLSALSDEVAGDWMVIHGHKHFPKIYYGSSTSGQGPVVFSVGSFSGDISGELGTVTHNQFYLLEFDLDKVATFGLVGRFRSWDWAMGRGWLPASDRSGLPKEGGFGHIMDLRRLMRTLSKDFTDKDTYEKNEILEKLPELMYVTPAGLRKFKEESENEGKFEIFLESGTITSMSRMRTA